MWEGSNNEDEETESADVLVCLKHVLFVWQNVSVYSSRILTNPFVRASENRDDPGQRAELKECGVHMNEGNDTEDGEMSFGGVEGCV